MEKEPQYTKKPHVGLRAALFLILAGLVGCASGPKPVKEPNSNEPDTLEIWGFDDMSKKCEPTQWQAGEIPGRDVMVKGPIEIVPATSCGSHETADASRIDDSIYLGNKTAIGVPLIFKIAEGDGSGKNYKAVCPQSEKIKDFVTVIDSERVIIKAILNDGEGYRDVQYHATSNRNEYVHEAGYFEQRISYSLRKLVATHTLTAPTVTHTLTAPTVKGTLSVPTVKGTLTVPTVNSEIHPPETEDSPNSD